MPETAADHPDALDLARRLSPDLALVDVHLQDGPTGIELARHIAADCGVVALFMTANVRRLPHDFAGACGVIGKPYSEHGMKSALRYLDQCIHDGRAPGLPPAGLQLAPLWAVRWGLGDLLRTA